MLDQHCSNDLSSVSECGEFRELCVCWCAGVLGVGGVDGDTRDLQLNDA